MVKRVVLAAALGVLFFEGAGLQAQPYRTSPQAEKGQSPQTVEDYAGQMIVQAEQESTLLAQVSSRPPRSYIEIEKPRFELKSISSEETKVSWNVVFSNRGGRYHTLDVHIRFFDDRRSQVLEDTVRRVYVPAGEKITVTHEIVTDGRTANSIRTAVVSARQRGKADSAGISK